MKKQKKQSSQQKRVDHGMNNSQVALLIKAISKETLLLKKGTTAYSNAKKLVRKGLFKAGSEVQEHGELDKRYFHLIDPVEPAPLQR